MYYQGMKIKISLAKGFTGLAYLLFFMMLFVPTTYQEIKAGLLAVVLMAAILPALEGKSLPIHKEIGMLTLFMVCVSLSFIALGVVNNNPGALRVGTVYLLWPIVYTILLSGINSRRVVDGLFKVLVFSLIAISLYSIYYLLFAAGIIPSSLYFEINMGQAVGFYEGYIEYSLYNISTLNFLVPFVFAMVLTWPNNGQISKKWLWLALVFGFSIAILSGRRALWLVVGLSPFIILLARLFMDKHYKYMTRKKFKRIAVGLAVTMIGLVTFGIVWIGIDMTVIWEMLEAGFDFSGNGSGGASESVRAEQFFTLLEEWQKSPLIGAGHGASAVGSLRSTEQSWAYELSYMALLFHTGLVGILLYGSAVTWIYWMGLRIMRSGHWLAVYMLPVLVGTTCFLIANATNPYLEKFDYIWVIFLPVALINIWLLDKNKIRYLKEEL